MTESRKRASAGIPSVDGGDNRVSELEERLARLEGSSRETIASMRQRGQKLMSRVMPAEASQHFRNAGREQLMGIRSIVDFWIRRIDAMEDRSSGDAGRERIELD